MTYTCPACLQTFGTFGDMQTHRQEAHGRTRYGELVQQLSTSNDEAERRYAATHAANQRMLVALIDAEAAVAVRDWQAAQAAIKRGLGEDV